MITYHQTAKAKKFLSRFLPGFITMERHVSELGEVKEAYFLEKIGLEKEREEAKILYKKLEYQKYVGKFLIYVTNKMENIQILYCSNIINDDEKDINIECINILTGDSVIPDGKLFVYTEQKFDALNMLTPAQKLAIFFFQEHEVVLSETEKQIESSNLWKEKCLKQIKLFESHINKN